MAAKKDVTTSINIYISAEDINRCMRVKKVKTVREAIKIIKEIIMNAGESELSCILWDEYIYADGTSESDRGEI
jgi:hypothetical protein